MYVFFFDLSLYQMRKYIAVIFLIIFSFQVLPLRVLGKLLAKGQTQEEEVKGDCNDDVKDDALKYLDYVSHHAQYEPSKVFSERKAGFMVHPSEDVPVSYVTEILSPPPNC